MPVWPPGSLVFVVVTVGHVVLISMDGRVEMVFDTCANIGDENDRSHVQQKYTLRQFYSASRYPILILHPDIELASATCVGISAH